MKAGYLEDWTFHNTFSGTPQGGIVSPILVNIYLDRLEEFMMGIHPEQLNVIHRTRLQIPSFDEMDNGYKRLKYVRYADDFLIGVIGSKEDC